MGKRSGEKRQRRRVEVQREGKGRQTGRREEKSGRSSVTWAIEKYLGCIITGLKVLLLCAHSRKWD